MKINRTDTKTTISFICKEPNNRECIKVLTATYPNRDVEQYTLVKCSSGERLYNDAAFTLDECLVLAAINFWILLDENGEEIVYEQEN